MALFTVNTCARDDVVCSLRWEWEIQVRELGVSVFEVPAAHVKGRKRSRLLVCNSVAQSVIESVRGQHDEFVFVYQRLKKDGSRGRGKPHAVETTRPGSAHGVRPASATFMSTTFMSTTFAPKVPQTKKNGLDACGI